VATRPAQPSAAPAAPLSPALAPPVPAVLAGVGVAASATAVAQVGAIASILGSGLTAAAISGLLLSALLRFGISRDAADIAVRLAGRRPGWPQGVQVGRPGVATRDESAAALLYRAAYILAAAERLMASMASTRSHNGGRIDGLRDALTLERRYWHQHLGALARRAKAAAEVDQAAAAWGVLLGWYLGQAENHTPECIAANGHNFRADHRPAIGWPGTVHNGCSCYAGPPFANSVSVDRVTRGLTPE